MNTQPDGPQLLVTLTVEDLRQLIREEVAAAPHNGSRVGEDRLLSVEEAATRLGVSKDYLYRNAPQLPFTRKLAPKLLRFSSKGIEAYLKNKKPSP